jgi:hypothetical protein
MGLLPRSFEVNGDYMFYGGKAFFKIVQDEDEVDEVDEDDESKRALELKYLTLPKRDELIEVSVGDQNFNKVRGVW